jgi:hypothetical protein
MKRTATDTLIHIMEEFGKAEPHDCIVIWTDEEGDICWSSSTDSYCTKIGLLETAKLAIANQFAKLGEMEGDE